MGSHKKSSAVNTPYDDAFRTMINECQQLLIPLINLVFGKNYSSDAKVVLNHNEYFIHTKSGDEKKRITDSFFTIDGDTYNFECQSTDDKTMIVRIFEYAFVGSLETAVFTSNGVMETTFPRTVILYLRSSSDIPEKFEHLIHFPEGDFRTYTSIVKIKDYSLSDIFEKKLYFLLPFFAFTHERDLKVYNSDPKRLEELKQEYLGIIYNLEQAQMAGEIRQFDVNTIVTMSRKVLDKLANKYKNVRKGVGSIMGGKILDYPAKRIFNEGRAEGMKEGRAEGLNIANERVAKDMLSENLPIAMIAKISRLSEDAIRSIAASIGVKLA